MRRVVEAKPDVGARRHLQVERLAAVVDAVRPDRIHDRARGRSLEKDRLAGERIGRNFGEDILRDVCKGLGPVASLLAVSLAGLFQLLL